MSNLPEDRVFGTHRASETPARKKRRAKARKAQEERWAAKAGPPSVYYRDPVTGEERAEKPSE
jgi:hypothetical protein